MKTNIRIQPINLVLVSVFALIAILYGTAHAQQQQSRWNDQQNQAQMAQPQQGQQSAMTQQGGQETMSRQGQQGAGQPDVLRGGRQGFAQQQGVNLWKLDPQGTATMAFDFNNDGIFDAHESITVYDLQKMQAQRHGQQISVQQGADQRMGQTVQDRQGELQGRVVDIRTVQIANTGETHLVAKIETDRGVAKVDLGPQEDLSELNLQKGKYLKVFGFDGKINDNFILLADRLQVDGKRVNIDREDTRPLYRLNATVLNTRSLTKEDNKMVMARVQLQNGTRTLVNLGPQQQLPQISHGQQMQILARLTEIDGKKALIADRLRTNGQTYQVDWEDVRTLGKQST